MSIYTEINLTEFQIYKNKLKSVYLFKPNSVYLARRAKVRELIAYVSNSTSLANIWSYLSGKKKSTVTFIARVMMLISQILSGSKNS